MSPNGGDTSADPLSLAGRGSWASMVLFKDTKTNATNNRETVIECFLCMLAKLLNIMVDTSYYFTYRMSNLSMCHPV